jgi:GT2 family glycosyltransferase
MMPETTIVIPAYKPVDLLKRCIESVISNTDMTRVEIIVVCNGSDRASADYLLDLNHPSIRLIWHVEALGYPKATNIGLKAANTPYLILLNTDAVVLPNVHIHFWVDALVNPMKMNSNIAVTGVAEVWLRGKLFFPFYCVGLQKDILEIEGYLDEGFSPGYGEDTDYCFRVANLDYELKMVTKNVPDHVNKINLSEFPIHHVGHASFPPEQAGPLLDRAYGILIDRYFK